MELEVQADDLDDAWADEHRVPAPSPQVLAIESQPASLAGDSHIALDAPDIVAPIAARALVRGESDEAAQPRTKAISNRVLSGLAIGPEVACDCVMIA